MTGWIQSAMLLIMLIMVGIGEFIMRALSGPEGDDGDDSE